MTTLDAGQPVVPTPVQKVRPPTLLSDAAVKIQDDVAADLQSYRDNPRAMTADEGKALRAKMAVARLTAAIDCIKKCDMTLAADELAALKATPDWAFLVGL